MLMKARMLSADWSRDVLTEGGHAEGPGRAGIDPGRHAAAPGDAVGVNPEVVAPPEEVGVQVDESWRHQLPGCGDDLAGGVRGQPLRDRGDTVTGDRHLTRPVDPVGGVDDVAAGDDGVVVDGHHRRRSSTQSSSLGAMNDSRSAVAVAGSAASQWPLRGSNQRAERSVAAPACRWIVPPAGR